MDRIIIKGGTPLYGEIPISGAKNACLALMPAALLTDEIVTLDNVPLLSDIQTMKELLLSLGCEVSSSENDRQLVLSASKISNFMAEYDIVRKMRASILVLGPLLARERRATVSLPGGCAIGARPVDIHLKALKAMGASLELRKGYIYAEAKEGLRGVEYDFPAVSVGATENIIIAATLAKGITTLKNCATEPEIVDLCKCLKSMGARIEGEGTSIVTIKGVNSLNGTSHSIIIDRIELGTYMLAPAIAGGAVLLRNCKLDLIKSFAEKLKETGAEVIENEKGLLVRGPESAINPTHICTSPYPGFPTDLQAQMMALLSLSSGKSVFEENIFENRFMHVPELNRMGAQIYVEGGVATVKGVKRLKGAPVMATDLRASVSLILAGLAAHGKTIINRVYHLDRGYESVEKKLSACGAKIKRIKG